MVKVSAAVVDMQKKKSLRRGQLKRFKLKANVLDVALDSFNNPSYTSNLVATVMKAAPVFILSHRITHRH